MVAKGRGSYSVFLPVASAWRQGFGVWVEEAWAQGAGGGGVLGAQEAEEVEPCPALPAPTRPAPTRPYPPRPQPVGGGVGGGSCQS